MRKIILALALSAAAVLPAAASGAPSLTQGLEKLVTCGHGALAKQAVAAVEASSKFRQDPDHKGFYVPTSNMVVFGLTLRYVSLQGTKYRRVPMVVLQGAWPELFKQLNALPYLGFACMQISCLSKVSPHHVVQAGPSSFTGNISPARFPQGAWVVQCGYFAK